MTPKEIKDREVYMLFGGLVNALVDVIEEDVLSSAFCKMQIKFKSKNLLEELKRFENKLFPVGDHGEASTQYMEAGLLMVKFFKIGLLMNELGDIKAQGLQTQLNILFKSYGIEFE